MNNFITNSDENKNLKDRLVKLITKSTELRFLVGFFYFSGWQEIYKSLQKNNQVVLKILVGLQVDKHLLDIVELGIDNSNKGNNEHFFTFMKSLGYAINNAEMDNKEFYEQVDFFVKLLEEDRLIIRKTLNPNHAKLYIFHLEESIADIINSKGHFITGSSNLTKAGLKAQNEFNVEIKDYGFEEANIYFEDLWAESVKITETANGKDAIIDFLKNKAQSSLITPFEAYVYILKTYVELQDNKKIAPAIERIIKEAGFKKFSYQVDAVNQAINVIETYNGVIIADVVGLGKSVIASLIAKQLGRRGLIICPPGLIGDKHENTGWWEYINRFKLYDWDIESTGRLEEISNSLISNDMGYEVVIVDEAHRFRNQDTSSYAALADICRGKQVILLTATPFNNSPADIFSLLKLFIIPGRSPITIELDLEGRFHSYNYRFKTLSSILKNYNSKDPVKRAKAENLYVKVFGFKPPVDVSKVKSNISEMANSIKSIISPITIRRNRLDLKGDYVYSKEVTTLSNIDDPIELFFELSEEQSLFYDTIIKNYFGQEGKFKGAIYRPFAYETKQVKRKDEETNRTFVQQQNLYDFVRRLLIKRFESSFGAFAKSIERFIKIHELVLSFIQTSDIYFLDRGIIESIYNDEDNAEDFIQEKIEEAVEQFKEKSKTKYSETKAKIYKIKSFVYKDEFLNDIRSDINLFKEIKKDIVNLMLVDKDPKRKSVLDKVKKVLSGKSKPKRKILIFSEYTDTVKHLKSYFEKNLLGRVLACSGTLTKEFSKQLNHNFNAMSKVKKDDFDVLITSDKLSEGVNLNRAGLIINYDIPWNPTRVIQRLGRINRIGVKVFENLQICNIFPTEQGADHVKIREISEQKMFLIHNALGEDSKIFNPEEQPTASKLFVKINSNPENDEEVSIDTLIRNEYKKIKSKYPDIINKISELPNRTKTSKKHTSKNVIVLKKKGLALFALLAKSEKNKTHIEEQIFSDLLEFVKCEYDTPREKLSSNFWNRYDKCKDYKPKYRTGRKNLSIELKASNNLKFLKKERHASLDRKQLAFIDTLLKDIDKYKTISKYNIRKLVLPAKPNENDYNNLIKQITKFRLRFGIDYLDILLSSSSKITDDIIIAVENV